jgi:nitroreductase
MLIENLTPLDPAWYEAISKRISRRAFDGRPVPTDDLERLRTLAADFHPSPDVRIEIATEAPDELFKGYVGSYGRVRGARAVAAFIGREGSKPMIGYVGEAFILEATRLGLDTCWVAGSFDRSRTSSVFHPSADEKILSITPVGFAVETLPLDERAMRGVVRSAARKPLSVIAPGSESWPGWAKDAAEAARWAPTGGNGQPQRLRFEDGALVVGSAMRAYWTGPIDLGIAMLHAELGALHAGVRGTWEALPEPDLARFVPRLMSS